MEDPWTDIIFVKKKNKHKNTKKQKEQTKKQDKESFQIGKNSSVKSKTFPGMILLNFSINL